MRFFAAVGAFVALINTANAAQAVGLYPPPTGSVADFIGRVHGFVNPTDFRAIVMLSADGGATWYDKDHMPNSGLTIAADGSFRLNNWAGDPQGDAQVPTFGAWIVEPGFFGTPFVCEGQPVPNALTAAAVASVVVNRNDASNVDSGPDAGANPGTAATPTPASNTGGSSPAPAITKAPSSSSGGGGVTANSALSGTLSSVAGAAALIVGAALVG